MSDMNNPPECAICGTEIDVSMGSGDNWLKITDVQADGKPDTGRLYFTCSLPHSAQLITNLQNERGNQNE